MKNLKKVLSLVLVLAMVFALGVSASAASISDYSDADKIENTEAVAVMSAIGVLDGSKGAFNPKGIVTREQAAKIVTYMLMGKTNADKLTATVAPFADVAANRWSAGAIAYCKEMGYISGVGNNKFDPAGELTGLQFAKIMLTALGYDAKKQGLVGSSWAVNVANLAINNGIDAGIDNLNAPMTRELAAQMAYNTMTADMVYYPTAGGNISIGGVDIGIGGSPATTLGNAEAKDYRGQANGDEVMQFCEKYASKLTMDLETGADDFGRPVAYTWNFKGAPIYTASQEAVVEYTALTGASAINKTLKRYSVDANAKVITNGVSANFTVAANSTLGDTLAALTANGTQVEVYATNRVVTEVVVVDYSTGVLNVSTAKKTGDVTYTVGGKTGKDFADEDTPDTVVVNGDVAKGDIVTYVQAKGNLYIYPTTEVTGKQTSTKFSNGVKTIVVDGETYTIGKATLTAVADYVNSTVAANYYIDQFGYVVYTDSIYTASTDYALIDRVNVTVSADFDSAVTPTVKARVVLADGSVGIYNVALAKNSDGDVVVKNTNVEVPDVATANWDKLDDIYGYTINEDVITLEPMTALTASTAAGTVAYQTINNAFDSKDASYSSNGTSLFTSNTTYVVYNSTKRTAKVYDGVKAVPEIKNGNAFSIVTTSAAGRGTATLVFVIVTSDPTASVSTDLVYVTGDYRTDGAGNDAVNVYTAYDAEGNTVEVSVKGTVTAGLYALKTDGTLDNNATQYNGTNVVRGLATVDSGMVLVDNNWYYMTEDTTTVIVDGNLEEADGNNCILVLNAKDASVVDAIFVVSAPATPAP